MKKIGILCSTAKELSPYFSTRESLINAVNLQVKLCMDKIGSWRCVSEIRNSKKENIEQIYQLVQNTINVIYPLYYPQGVVEFFRGLHSKENIATDIENGFVRVLSSGDCLVGTGCCKENHISRLFVTSDFQKKGYGNYIMQYLEKEIPLNHTVIYLDASLAAACFYEHRGYKTLKHEELFINENARLAYEVMEKRIAVPNTDIFIMENTLYQR